METTLEHCVQRLRKRMTAESEAAQLAAMKQHHSHHAGGGLTKKDR